jgi:hypothetical protein
MAASTGKRPVTDDDESIGRDSLQRPDSATHFGVNLAALAVGLLILYLLSQLHPGAIDASVILIATCASIAIIIVGGERLWRGSSLIVDAGLNLTNLRRLSIKHAATRVFGLVLTLGLIALTYWLFPEYHGDFYNPFWRFLRLLAPAVVPAALVYFLWSDSRLDGQGVFLAVDGCVPHRSDQRHTRSARRRRAEWAAEFLVPIAAAFRVHGRPAVLRGRLRNDGTIV